MTRALKRAFAVLSIAVMLGACTPEEAVINFFADNYEEAAKIVECESGWDAGAVSPSNDHGLFQINAIHRQQFEAVTGMSWDWVYDPYWNAFYAKWLYDQQGWGPWSCRRVL